MPTFILDGGFNLPALSEAVHGVCFSNGEVLPVMTMLGILELSLVRGSALSSSDGRTKWLRVWESLGDLYGVCRRPNAVVVSRAALVLALNALLVTDDPPPRVEMYVSVLDAEFAAFDWRLLGQLSPDCALYIEQIEEDWRACEADGLDEPEGSISDTAEDLLW